jgi:hypothetical protein
MITKWISEMCPIWNDSYGRGLLCFNDVIFS